MVFRSVSLCRESFPLRERAEQCKEDGQHMAKVKEVMTFGLGDV